MKIIVTCGAGFLGSRVITQLLSAQNAGALDQRFERIVSLYIECPMQDDRVESHVGELNYQSSTPHTSSILRS